MRIVRQYLWTWFLLIFSMQTYYCLRRLNHINSYIHRALKQWKSCIWDLLIISCKWIVYNIEVEGFAVPRRHVGIPPAWENRDFPPDLLLVFSRHLCLYLSTKCSIYVFPKPHTVTVCSRWMPNYRNMLT